MPNTKNIIGRKVAYWRNHKKWSQELLVAKLTVIGCYMTRSILASIETRRCPATDIQIEYFAYILDISRDQLFPEKRHFSGKPVGLEKCPPTRRRRKRRNQEDEDDSPPDEK
jgi:transcriptional regulator with XRE-family HTH domain